MARQQNSLWKIAGILAIALFLLVMAVGGFFLLKKQDTFARLQPFPVDAYLNGGNLWSYDDYLIEGRVDNVVYRSRASDRIVASIQPAGSKIRLPVIIERDPAMKSVQLEQELRLKVTLGPNHEILCRQYQVR